MSALSILHLFSLVQIGPISIGLEQWKQHASET